jgi:hypothetical protein
MDPPVPGPKVAPGDVKAAVGTNLYDPAVVRTVFLKFENADWEKELSDFANTDVEVGATVTVDGRTYSDVGIHFRGASSYFTVGEGFKHSLNLSFDFVHKGQALLGYRTLNLLNSHGDPSFLRTVLYSEIARQFMPTPRANFVKVVINGESWGVYVNAQQFNKDLAQDQFGTSQGARWKVPGSPRGRGNLAYLGDDVEEYRGIYEIRSKDEPKSWAALIQLCRTLAETPAHELEKALEPQLDVDGALKFLAVENAVINNDGYWVRTSDYNLYRDPKGRFHLLPHDLNESFNAPMGPGFARRLAPGAGPGPDFGPGGPPERGGDTIIRVRPGNPGEPEVGQGPGGGAGPGPVGRVDGVKLDPLNGADDANKPLISKLLAVPSLRARYLGYVREIATRWLDWKNLGPIATRYHQLIAAEVAADTRKLSSTEAFRASLEGNAPGSAATREEPVVRGPGGRRMALKEFADQRRAYLLERLDELEKPAK